MPLGFKQNLAGNDRAELHSAVAMGDIGKVRELLRKRADVNAKD
jgi:hypothetical protein